MPGRERGIDTESLRKYAEVLERHREELNAELTATAMEIPQLAAVVAAMDPADRAAATERSWHRTRRALVDGDWTEYLAGVDQEGETYARLGISLDTWFGLLADYRRALLPRIMALPRMEALAALDGENIFHEIAMARLSQAYLAAKEREVRKAETEREMFAELVRRSSLGVAIYEWTASPDLGSFRLIRANPAATRLSPGVEARLGTTFADTQPELLQTEIPARIAAVLRGGEPQDWTQVDAERRTWKCHTFALADRVAAVLFEDITADLEMEQLLKVRLTQLERSNRELDAFAYVASHDLKAPLQDIRNLAAWIREDAGTQLPPDTLRHLDLLADRVQRMERLLDDLLDYSRVGRMFEAPGEFQLDAALAGVVAYLRPPPGFTVLLDGPSQTIFTPRTPFEKVLRNLIGNAVKHHDRSSGTIRVSAHPNGEHLSITVSDDGPGIPAEYQERVFQMFQTLRPKDEMEGSGVGLTIVKKTVEWLGGRVDLASVGRGTHVTFTWPLTMATDPERAA